MTTARSLTTLSGVISAVVVAALGFYGGWQRRWMSDDGLIVLRTVRNLLAGNGPVFNAGERVETNTSTLWQYIIYIGALISGSRLETIALWAALVFTTVALFIAAVATVKLYQGNNRLLLLPFGGILYISLPPARDFATSGLEWGLSLLWIATWWFLMVQWAEDAKLRWGIKYSYLLAFCSGLSWLVRPELALYGGLSGLMLLIMDRKNWWKILLAAIPVPLAYQVFRMGYYGLLVPHTAVAKSASGSQWGDGWFYLMDFVTPYHLWLGVLIAAAAAGLRVWNATREASISVNRRTVVIGLTCGAALIHFLYVLRVGGDFMHGRMLLLPLFTLLLPVSVVVIDRQRIPTTVAAAGLFIAGIGWSFATVLGGHPYQLPEGDEAPLRIVDERIFWQLATYRDQPTRYAEDFLTARNMNNFVPMLERGRAAHDAQLFQIRLSQHPLVLSWEPRPRTTEHTDLADMPLSLTMINLGMTSMNAPLDVRVLDNMGLANPLAGRQPRVVNGRVGHDKNLPLEWQVADSAVPLDAVPSWVDKAYVKRAREILYTPEYQKLFASYRSPLTFKRFLANIKFSLGAGRTLQFQEDPAAYQGPLPVVDPLPINWPRDIKLDPVR